MRRIIGLACAALAAALVVPGSALAHGLQQRADLPIPEWLFGWAAAIVLVVSFAALSILWPKPKLESNGDWRSLGAAGRALGSRAVEIACGAIGVAMLIVGVVAGYMGSLVPQDNLLSVLVSIVVWVGFVFLSVLFGDLFRAFNPWRAIARTGGWLYRRATGRAWTTAAYPERLGRWPAVAGIVVFTWIELVGRQIEEPRTLATLVIVYSVVALAGMARYGADTWAQRGEAFGVYFGLFSRLSPFETRDRVVGVRPPLSGLTRLERMPGTVPLVAVMIGTVTYDGLSQGTLWRDISLELDGWWTDLGFSVADAAQVSGTIGLLAGISIVAGFYALGIGGARSVGGDLGAERLRLGFIHSLIPIAVVYVAAHYLTLFVFGGQSVIYLASDPFGQGWDLLGTANEAINYSVLSQNATWYFQVAFVVVGHVCALVLAHDRALVLYGQVKLAVRSQYWMLGIMVGFTTLALWLLAQANA